MSDSVRRQGVLIDMQVNGDGSWRFREPRPGQLEVFREHSCSGTQMMTDALGPYWLLGVAEIDEGGMQFNPPHGPILKKGNRCGVYFPSFSLVFTKMDKSLLKFQCFVSRGQMPAGLPAHAVTFPWRAGASGATVESLLQAIRDSQTTAIEFNPSPSATAAKIKRKLEQSFKSSKSLGELAAECRMSQTLFGRHFKKEFGLTPVQYRNHLRVATSTFDLLAGKSVTDVFTEVGFEDLGRYIKQFRRVTGTTPKSFRAKKKKSRKTPSRR